ncbi:Protein kinase-like domain [Penicillium camemberti]|uniref:Protein kinase-like domain n=1 Tax=Penicillium camemberti (strain FM 013) TaxID=1429867 RepID=A0A0G4P5X8_PENC3|nr:Protein kinase-like domain [Penicillium camemberti]
MSSPAPIQNSVVQTSHSTWRLGCTIECDRISGPGDMGAAAAWKDGEHWRHCILSAVWAIGNNAICKVHYWNSDITSESETIKFVQERAPEVPVPEVIYSWVDGNRSFLVLKRVPGITLRDAWGTMSAIQQESVLAEVVHICDILASITSERLQNVHGGPVLEPYLAHSERDSLEPLSVYESKRYFFRENLDHNTEIEERFLLYHPDLGPGNILVSNHRLSAIIDWECAGFYPRFWVSTKPSVSPGLNFHPPILGIPDTEWRRRLRVKLEERGYPRFVEWFMDLRKTKSRYES